MLFIDVMLFSQGCIKLSSALSFLSAHVQVPGNRLHRVELRWMATQVLKVLPPDL